MAVDYFLDLELLPDPEFAAHLLLAALYAKLHRALVACERSDIAVSFPEYQTNPPSLGVRMRLLGSQQALQTLTAIDWLRGMHDHVKASNLARVPTDAAQRALRRVQAKSNPERLRRRLMKRHGLDETQARERIPDSAAETLHLPFVQLRSSSTGRTFRLFLSLGAEQPAPVSGKFNTHGLSQTATVPWF